VRAVALALPSKPRAWKIVMVMVVAMGDYVGCHSGRD
jgi:hypothetical protein